MLDELAATGYVGTELGDWGYMPTQPETLQAEMAKRGLAMVGGFVPVALKDPSAHVSGEARALKVAGLLAGVAELSGQDQEPFVVLADANGTDPTRIQNAGRITPEMSLSNEAWQVFAQGADRIALAVRDRTGLPTVFHPHCAGFVETPEEIARLLDLTDPALLGLAFDTGHFLYGSRSNDPQQILDGLDRFDDRIRHLHFKDCHAEVATRSRSQGWDYFRAVRQGLFCELGQGAVDFPSILSWLDGRGYEGWAVVEQDVLPGMGTPRESAERNRAYLSSIGV